MYCLRCRNHEMSIGCLIGGKDLQAEAERIGQINIVVATPGRLLQHIDESPLWDASRLLILGKGSLCFLTPCLSYVSLIYALCSRLVHALLPLSPCSLTAACCVPLSLYLSLPPLGSFFVSPLARFVSLAGSLLQQQQDPVAMCLP